MGIQVLQPPRGALAEIVPHLVARRPRVGSTGADALGRALTRGVRLSAPHPMFNLALVDIHRGGSMEAARMTGWAYWLLASDAVVGRVELRASWAQARPRFALLASGRLSIASARALQSAESHRAVQREAYVLGAIRVPDLHVHALWLRALDQDAQADLFVPVRPTDGPGAPAPALRHGAMMKCLVEAKARRESRHLP